MNHLNPNKSKRCLWCGEILEFGFHEGKNWCNGSCNKMYSWLLTRLRECKIQAMQYPEVIDLKEEISGKLINREPAKGINIAGVANSLLFLNDFTHFNQSI